MNAEGAPLAVWTRLRDDPKASATTDIPSIETEVVTDGGAVRLALGDQGEARLLIALTATDTFPQIGDPAGLLILDRYLTAAVRIRYLDITCRRPELDRAFSDLTSDVLRRLSEGEAPGPAVSGAIQEFRELLLRAATETITLETALGLIAELMVLNDLLRLDSGAWTGWTGGTISARHDFRAGPAALEVKAGLRGPALSVEISAPDQLLEPEGGRLHLVHVVVERDAAGPLSVERLAQQAVNLASDPEAVLDLLADRDYRPAQAAAWEPYRFSPFRRDIYRVEEGFPRLVPADFRDARLPPGVSHFHYRVDLSVAAGFRLDGVAHAGVLADFLQELP